jgi:hypothetical protein
MSIKKTTVKLDLAQTRRKHQLRVEMFHNKFRDHGFRDGSHANTKLPLPGTKVSRDPIKKYSFTVKIALEYLL